MSGSSDLTTTSLKARGDVMAARTCLRCKAVFQGQRICPRCKNTVSWRSGLSGGQPQTGRRTSGRSSSN